MANAIIWTTGVGAAIDAKSTVTAVANAKERPWRQPERLEAALVCNASHGPPLPNGRLPSPGLSRLMPAYADTALYVDITGAKYAAPRSTTEGRQPAHAHPRRAFPALQRQTTSNPDPA
jgi:hypothetical protein